MNEDVALTGGIRLGWDQIIYALVADGMGGHQGGEIASRVAIREFALRATDAALQFVGDQDFFRMRRMLAAAFHASNNAVIHRASEDAGLHDMGTTLTTCVLAGNVLFIGSVGDSRTYLYRDHSVNCLTRDDSVVQSLVDAGVITPEEAQWHPRANEITRALGTPGDTDQLVIATHAICPGDICFTCSDGLWKTGEENLCSACALLNDLEFTQENLDEALALLVEQAFDHGSDDNISVAALWIKPEERCAN